MYPGIDRTNFNEPAVLDRVQSDIAWYTALVRAHAPAGTQIWAGEDGPTGGGEDGTCGAQTACGTYATTLWYADDMAQRASAGFAQYQRQTIVGGRYGLLSIPHGNEALGANDAVGLNPDFWVNFLWKRVLGATVLNATLAESRNGTLRAYAFCGAPPSPHRPAATANAIGLLLINLATAPQPVILSSDRAASYAAWTLEPSAVTEYPEGVPSAAAHSGVNARERGPGEAAAAPEFAKTARLNGVELPQSIADGAAIGPIPGVAPSPTAGTVPLALPPISVSFVALTPKGGVAPAACR